MLYTNKSAKPHPEQTTKNRTDLIEIAMMIVIATSTPVAELSGSLRV